MEQQESLQFPLAPRDSKAQSGLRTPKTHEIVRHNGLLKCLTFLEIALTYS